MPPMSRGQVCVRKYISVRVRIVIGPMGQCGEPAGIQILKAQLCGNLLQALDRHYVDRITDGIADRCGAIEGPGCVIDRRAVRIGIRLVFKGRCQGHPLLVESRSIGGNDLKGRSGLTGGIRCTVKRQAGCLFAASADESLDIAGMLVNDAHRRLRLRRKADPLRDFLDAGGKNALLVLIHIGLPFFLENRKSRSKDGSESWK